MSVCQPRPCCWQAASTSGSRRIVWFTLRVAFGGRPLPRRNSSCVAFAPISPGSTSAAGRDLAISFCIHSGLSVSGREGLGFRVLLIQFFLFPVSFPEADNAKFVLSWGDNGGVQAGM